MRFHSGIAAMLIIIATASGARADDVTDQINEALKAYQNHDTQTAVAALDGAANLLRQARAEGLKKSAAAGATRLDRRRRRGHRGRFRDARRRHHRKPHLSQRPPAGGGADHGEFADAARHGGRCSAVRSPLPAA